MHSDILQPVQVQEVCPQTAWLESKAHVKNRWTANKAYCKSEQYGMIG